MKARERVAWNDLIMWEVEQLMHQLRRLSDLIQVEGTKKGREISKLTLLVVKNDINYGDIREYNFR